MEVQRGVLTAGPGADPDVGVIQLGALDGDRLLPADHDGKRNPGGLEALELPDRLVVAARRPQRFHRRRPGELLGVRIAEGLQVDHGVAPLPGVEAGEGARRPGGGGLLAVRPWHGLYRAAHAPRENPRRRDNDIAVATRFHPHPLIRRLGSRGPAVDVLRSDPGHGGHRRAHQENRGNDENGGGSVPSVHGRRVLSVADGPTGRSAAAARRGGCRAATSAPSCDLRPNLSPAAPSYHGRSRRIDGRSRRIDGRSRQVRVCVPHPCQENQRTVPAPDSSSARPNASVTALLRRGEGRGAITSGGSIGNRPRSAAWDGILASHRSAEGPNSTDRCLARLPARWRENTRSDLAPA